MSFFLDKCNVKFSYIKDVIVIVFCYSLYYIRKYEREINEITILALTSHTEYRDVGTGPSSPRC